MVSLCTDLQRFLGSAIEQRITSAAVWQTSRSTAPELEFWQAAPLLLLRHMPCPPTALFGIGAVVKPSVIITQCALLLCNPHCHAASKLWNAALLGSPCCCPC
jgi:hypothetical protein